MAVRLGKPAIGGIVVAAAEVVVPGLLVVVLPAIAEGVIVKAVRIFLLAEGVVGIGPVGSACGIGQIYHIAVGVIQIVSRPHAAGPADQIGASKVIVGNASVFQLRCHIAAVQQEGRPDEAGHLAGTDTGGVVGVIGKRARTVGGAELVEMVVGIGGASAAADGFADDIAVFLEIVGIEQLFQK